MQDQIRDVLAAHGRMAVDPREVDEQADLYELGLTSHASVDVMLALEDAFDVEFPDEVLKKSTSGTTSLSAPTSPRAHSQRDPRRMRHRPKTSDHLRMPAAAARGLRTRLDSLSDRPPALHQNHRTMDSVLARP